MFENLKYNSLVKLNKFILPGLRTLNKSFKGKKTGLLVIGPQINELILSLTSFANVNTLCILDYNNSELLNNADLFAKFILKSYRAVGTKSFRYEPLPVDIAKKQDDYFNGSYSSCADSDLFLHDKCFEEQKLTPSFKELVLCDKWGNPKISLKFDDLISLVYRDISYDIRGIDNNGLFNDEVEIVIANIRRLIKEKSDALDLLERENQVDLWYYVGLALTDVPCQIYRNIESGATRTVTLYDLAFYKTAAIIKSIKPNEEEYNEIRDEYLAMLESMDRKEAIIFLENKYMGEQARFR